VTVDDCAALREVAAELVLGVASAEARGDALAHLATCVECQAHVRELTAAADSLLLLAPPVDPPPGFESRVLDTVAPRARRRRTRVLLAAAAVVVALAGALTFAVTRDGGESLRTAPLRTDDRAPVGEVFVYEGKPSWVFVSLRWAPDDEYRLELRLADGRVVRRRAPRIANGSGAWGHTIAVDPGRIRALRVVGEGGWHCTATFD
jgi:hypothetical protein